MNLQGMTATQAMAMANTCDDPQEFEDWCKASQWLAQVEHHAKLAETRAAAAFQAAEEDRWQEAVDDVELGLGVGVHHRPADSPCGSTGLAAAA